MDREYTQPTWVIGCKITKKKLTEQNKEHKFFKMVTYDNGNLSISGKSTIMYAPEMATGIPFNIISLRNWDEDCWYDVVLLTISSILFKDDKNELMPFTKIPCEIKRKTKKALKPFGLWDDETFGFYQLSEM